MECEVVKEGFGRLKPPPRVLPPVKRFRGVAEEGHQTLLKSFAVSARIAEMQDDPQSATLQESLQTLALTVAALPRLPDSTIHALERIDLQKAESRLFFVNIIRLYEARVVTLERELIQLSAKCSQIGTLQKTLSVEKAQGDQLRAVFRALLPLQVLHNVNNERSKKTTDPKELLRLTKEIEEERGRAAEYVQKIAKLQSARIEDAEALELSSKKLKAVISKVGPLTKDNEELKQALQSCEEHLHCVAAKAEEDLLAARLSFEAEMETVNQHLKRSQDAESNSAKKLTELNDLCRERDRDLTAAQSMVRLLERNRDEDMMTISSLRDEIEGFRDVTDVQKKTLGVFLDKLVPYCSDPGRLQGSNLVTTVNMAIDDIITLLSTFRTDLETSKNVVRTLKDLTTMHKDEVAEITAERDSLVKQLAQGNIAGVPDPAESMRMETSVGQVAWQGEAGRTAGIASETTDRASSPCFPQRVQNPRGLTGAIQSMAAAKKVKTALKTDRSPAPAVGKKMASFLDRMEKGQADRSSKWKERREQMKQTRAQDAVKAMEGYGHTANEENDQESAEVETIPEKEKEKERPPRQPAAAEKTPVEKEKPNRSKDAIARLMKKPAKEKGAPLALEDAVDSIKQMHAAVSEDSAIPLTFTQKNDIPQDPSEGDAVRKKWGKVEQSSDARLHDIMSNFKKKRL